MIEDVISEINVCIREATGRERVDATLLQKLLILLKIATELEQNQGAVVQTRRVSLNPKPNRVYPIRRDTKKTHGPAVLNENDVLEIFSSDERTGILADRYGVHTTTIRDIKRGYSWASLTNSVGRPAKPNGKTG